MPNDYSKECKHILFTCKNRHICMCLAQEKMNWRKTFWILFMLTICVRKPNCVALRNWCAIQVGESFSGNFVRPTSLLADLVRVQLGLKVWGRKSDFRWVCKRWADHQSNKQAPPLPLWPETQLEEHAGWIWGLKGISWYPQTGSVSVKLSMIVWF